MFTTPGQIRKRYGSASITTACSGPSPLPSTISSGNFVAAYVNETLMNDNWFLWSYSPADSKWIYKAPNPICAVTNTPIYRNSNSQINPDMATNGTVQVTCWTEVTAGTPYGVLYVQVNDWVTGTVLYNGTLGTGLVNQRVVNNNGTICVFWCDNLSNINLNGAVWNGTGFTTVLAINTGVQFFDAVSNGTHYIVSFFSDAGIKTVVLDNTLSQVSYYQSNIMIEGNTLSMCYDTVTGYTWTATANSSSLQVYALNAAITGIAVGGATITAANITHATVTSAGQNVYLFYDQIASPTSNSVTTLVVMSSGGSIVSTNTFSRSVYLASKAWIMTVANTGVQIPLVTTIFLSNLQPTYFVMAWINQPVFNTASLASVVAKLSPGTAAAYSPSSYQYLSSVTLLSNSYYFVQPQVDLLYTNSAGGLNTYTNNGVALYELDFNATNPDTTLLNNNLLIGGGVVRGYDGVNCTEQNFNLYPEGVTAVPGSYSSATTIGPGMYGYIATYEWVDAQGQTHRSQVSVNVSATIPSSGLTNPYNLVTVPTLRVTDKQNVQICLYRTAANQTVYYRLNPGSGAIANNLSSDTVTWSDTVNDSSIVGNEQLYTTGEAGNSAPPASVLMSTALNRTILVPSETPTSWWYSKENPPGSPPEFSDQFVNNCDPTGGPITAVQQMDSNLFLFKANSVYYVQGTGPANSGTGSTYTDAALLPTSSGSVTSYVVLTTQGLMYQSQDGIWMLTRSLSDTFIGAPVFQYTDAITAATLIPTTTQVRFLTAAGYSLVYDYFANEWSTFSTYSGVGGLAVNGIYTALTAAGVCIQETPGSYNDSGAYVPLSLTLGWLEMAGLQGFQRVRKMYLLGDWKSAHNLTVQFAYDFGSVTQTDTFAVPGLLLPYQFRFFMNVQKCQAIQVTIADSQLSSQGEGFALSSLAFEVALKKGLSKNLNPNQSFG